MKRTFLVLISSVTSLMIIVILLSVSMNSPQSTPASIPNSDVQEPLPIQTIERELTLQDPPQEQQMTNPYFRTPCRSQPSVQFTHDVTEVSYIRAVEPSIPTPGNSRHRAWLDIDIGRVNKVPVYAPVDSDLVGGVYKTAKGATDFDLHFQVSCEI